MKHLRVLEQADLISVRREGRLRWNVLNRERLQEVPADYLEQWRAGENAQEENDNRLRIKAGVTSLEYAVSFPVTAERIYQAILYHVDCWWPDRTLAGSKVVMEPFVGGRFYETVEKDDASVLFGFVTCLRPDKEIRLLGPMDAVEDVTISSIQIQLQETDGRTHLHLNHRTVGEVDDSLNPLFANEWQERINHRLRAFLTEDSQLPAPSDSAR